MLTMIIGGLWHGAAWTFVLWGIYQGILLVAHRLAAPWLDRIHPTEPVDRACWKLVRIVATFHMICFGWLLFRAESLAQVRACSRRSSTAGDPGGGLPRCRSRSWSSRCCSTRPSSTSAKTST